MAIAEELLINSDYSLVEFFEQEVGPVWVTVFKKIKIVKALLELPVYALFPIDHSLSE